MSDNLNSLTEAYKLGFIQEPEFQVRKQALLEEGFTEVHHSKKRKVEIEQQFTQQDNTNYFANEVEQDNSSFIDPKAKNLILPNPNAAVTVIIENWKKEKNNKREPFPPTPETKDKWFRDQKEKKNLVNTNVSLESPQYIAGWDISFAPRNKIDAVVCVVICDLHNNLEIVHEVYVMVKLTNPYIAGFLAYREMPGYLAAFQHIPEKYRFNLVNILDGSGLLHMRNYGCACQIGVETNVPSIGCAKKLLYCDGIDDNYVLQQFRKARFNNDPSQYVSLIGQRSNSLKGFAYKPNNGSPTLYISPGHLIDAESSLNIVKMCDRNQELPLPVYYADKFGRDFLKLNYHKM